MSDTCAVCGTAFKRRNYRQRFCSHACRDADMERWVDLTCVGCGAAFRRHPWEVRQGRAKYCGPACFHRSTAGLPRVRKVDAVEDRACLVCLAPFKVGGSKHPKKSTRFCSVECRRLARYRNGRRAAALSTAQAAYLAGLIDGEGSIMLNPRGAGAITSRVAISNTHRGILDWVASTTGVGKVQTMRAEGISNRTSYAWVTNGDGALSLLEQVRPFMIVKTAQADLAIEAQRRLRDPSTKTGPWQQEYRERVQALNRRGPR